MTNSTNLKKFKHLVISRFIYAVALQMQAIVLGWQMYILTKNPLFLGLIGLAEAIPALCLALFSGYLVDHNNPITILRSVVTLGLVSALLLSLTHIPHLELPHSIQIMALFASSFLTGITRAFLHPTIYSIAPKLIERENLSKSAAWMTSAYQTACMSGPAIGGIIFGLVGMFYTSIVISSLIGLSIYFTLKVHLVYEKSKPKSDSFSFKKELLLGAKYVWTHPIMLPAMTLDMICVLFGGVTALLPIYAAEVLLVGPAGLGILRAAPAVGAAIISLWLTRTELKKNAGTWFLSCVAGFGGCILIFALSKSYLLSLIALTFSGGFDSVSAVIRGTIVQLSSPDHLRGRISSINMIFISSSNELGEFESGIAAKLLGTIPAAIFGSIVCLATVSLVALFNPKLRKLDTSTL